MLGSRIPVMAVNIDERKFRALNLVLRHNQRGFRIVFFNVRNLSGGRLLGLCGGRLRARGARPQQGNRGDARECRRGNTNGTPGFHRPSGETRLVSHRASSEPNVCAASETLEWSELQILTRHHSSLQGRRDIWRAGPSGCTIKLSEKFEPIPLAGSYKPGSTENAMPGSSMV